MDYSDAIILASEEVSGGLVEDATLANWINPCLPYVSFQESEEAYTNFYNTEVLKLIRMVFWERTGFQGSLAGTLFYGFSGFL